jgi:hypothetical protein
MGCVTIWATPFRWFSSGLRILFFDSEGGGGHDNLLYTVRINKKASLFWTNLRSKK